MRNADPLRFSHAICRRPGPDPALGQTAAALGPPDAALTLQQHDTYVEVLRAMGLTVTVLPALPGFPDAHFIEDTAVVTPEVAVLTRPGHPSRRGETESVAAVLAAYRPLARIEAPGTLDGGDVLQDGNHVFIGVSARTNAAGAEQLATILAGHGHTTTLVPVGAGLHFKSSVNEVGAALLVTEDYAGRPEFGVRRRLVVPQDEVYAGNTLRINDHLLMPAGFPRVRELLVPLGLPITTLDVSEMRKMDGGLTCLSLRY